MTKDNQQPIDFSMLLASSVHDIKNSLGMLLNSLDEVIDIEAEHNSTQRKNYSILRGEAARINQALIYLLGLYRLQQEQLTLNIAEIYVKDFLEEQVAAQQLLFDVNDITVAIDCDDTLIGYFDENLIAGVINNILVNGAKYTKNKISLSAKQTTTYLEMTITDNGSGYPQSIIDNLNNHQRGIDFSSGSTNLGLYFAQQIATFHSSKGQSGSIALSNLQGQQGGCFTLKLP